MTSQAERLRGERIETDYDARFKELPEPPERWKSFLAAQTPKISSYEELQTVSTPEYLRHMHDLAHDVITTPGYRDPTTGYISDAAWETLVSGGILAASFGDRDPATRQVEIMRIAEMLSYYDLSLGLTFGITTGLAIMPLQRFGTPKQKEKYLGMIRNGERMGLGVTQRDSSGSNALEMGEGTDGESTYTDNGNGTVTVRIAKHLQGLSGKSGLLVAATKHGASKKTVGMFVIPQEHINTQLIKVAGLDGIPYGVNTCNVTLSKEDHLMTEIPRDELTNKFQDMFTKSRILIVSMTLGHQERMEKDANAYAEIRILQGNLKKEDEDSETGKVKTGKLQSEMDVPRYILDSKMGARGTIIEAIFRRVAERITTETDTTNMVTEANIIKALSTEYALSSAAERAELMGGPGYYEESALQGYIDIWPFHIFEGPRHLLNTQIGRDIFRRGGGSDMWTVRNLDMDFYGILDLIVRHEPTTNVHDELMGRISSRIFALGCLNKNYYTQNPEEFEDAKSLLNHELKDLADEFFRVRRRAKKLGNILNK